MSIYSREVARLGRLADSHRIAIELALPASSVLDVGCASGYLARELLARGATIVDGLEFDRAEAEQAQAVCRTVVVGSVEDPEVVGLLPDASYDAIVLADVVEHLRDPEAAVRGLVPKLTAHGRIVLSVPNVAHYSVRLALLRGRFEYEDVGLLDRTHLRFFTRATLAELLDAVGLQLDREEFTFRYLPLASRLSAVPIVGAALVRAIERMARSLSGLLAYQFVISASPRTASTARRGA